MQVGRNKPWTLVCNLDPVEGRGQGHGSNEVDKIANIADNRFSLPFGREGQN